MMQLFPGLAGGGEGQPNLQPPDASGAASEGPACFQNMPFEEGEETWTSAANLVSVARYLRGNTHLVLPAAWRAVLPKRL